MVWRGDVLEKNEKFNVGNVGLREFEVYLYIIDRILWVCSMDITDEHKREIKVIYLENTITKLQKDRFCNFVVDYT